MPELECPKCEKILDVFVLDERSRCAYCGAESKEMIALLQVENKRQNEALKSIIVVFEHGGTINEVVRIAVEVL
jgi:hypothetical protein